MPQGQKTALALVTAFLCPLKIHLVPQVACDHRRYDQQVSKLGKDGPKPALCVPTAGRGVVFVLFGVMEVISLAPKKGLYRFEGSRFSW